ncbi:MAG: transferase, partial [Chloroflexota bacterium]
MVTQLVIIGAGGFGREVLDICEACNAVTPTFDVLGFIEDPLAEPVGTLVNDQPILGDFSWLARHVSAAHAVCAVGTPQVRRRLVLRAAELGCTFANVIHPAAILTCWVTLGQGVVIAAGNILSNQIRIG